MKNNDKNIIEKSEIVNDMCSEPSVFAVQCDVPFVVTHEKSKEFSELETNHELLDKTKRISNKIKIKNELESPEYQVYSVCPKKIITVPWDPEREERENKNCQKFLEQMKKIEEEKQNYAKRIELEHEGPILKKVNKPNK